MRFQLRIQIQSVNFVWDCQLHKYDHWRGYLGTSSHMMSYHEGAWPGASPCASLVEGGGHTQQQGASEGDLHTHRHTHTGGGIINSAWDKGN